MPADNYVVNPGTGGDTFAADDIGGVKTPFVKLRWGPLDTANDADIAAGKAIPVQLRGSDGTDRSNALPVSQSGTWTVQPGNTANTTAWKVDGSAVTQPVSGTVAISGAVAVNPKPTTSGGATPYVYLAAASANQDSQVIKASAGQLYGYDLFNANAAIRYVKFYDKATAPTSADTPKLVIMVPGNTAGAGAVRDIANGVAFASGIAMRITTGQANGDATAATAGDVVVNAQYA